MIYWKTVDAGDFETYAKKFLKYYIENKDSSFVFNKYNPTWNELKQEKIDEVLSLIPEMKEGLSQYGEINLITIMTILDKSQGISLHIDYTTGTNAGVQARLNIPVMNTKGSKTAFFEMNERQYNNHVENKVGTKVWPDFYKEKIKPASIVEIVSPTIIRTSVPHTVYFGEDNYPRIVITISFKDDVVKYLE